MGKDCWIGAREQKTNYVQFQVSALNSFLEEISSNI